MKNIYLFLCMLFIALSSCKDSDDQSIIAGDGEQEVAMRLQSPTPYSNPDPVNIEERTLQLDIVVFKEGIYQYWRKAYQSSTSYADYRSTLKIDSGLTLYFLANSRKFLEDNEGLMKEGISTIEQISSLFTLTTPLVTIDGVQAISMWGKLTGVTVTDKAINNLNEVKMFRSVAAAEVLFALDTDEFDFTEAYLYNPASHTSLIPDASIFNSSGEVVAAYCADNVTTTGYYYYDASYITENEDDFKKIDHCVYMFENDANDSKGRTQTRLVIGGKYDKSNSPTYYPLDFQYIDQNDEPQLMEVARNRKISIIVTSIKSEGWTDPDEAAEAAAVNIDYDVIDWDEYEESEIGIDGPFYLALSGKKTAVLGRKAGMHLDKKMTTNCNDLSKLKMKFLDEDGDEEIATTPIKNSGDEVIGVKSDVFSAELLFEGNKITHIRFTALQDWAGDYTELFSINLGRISFKITVTQTNSNSSDWIDGGDEGITVGKE